MSPNQLNLFPLITPETPQVLEVERLGAIVILCLIKIKKFPII
jgi:hypothetical protein